MTIGHPHSKPVRRIGYGFCGNSQGWNNRSLNLSTGRTFHSIHYAILSAQSGNNTWRNERGHSEGSDRAGIVSAEMRHEHILGNHPTAARQQVLSLQHLRTGPSVVSLGAADQFQWKRAFVRCPGQQVHLRRQTALGRSSFGPRTSVIAADALRFLLRAQGRRRRRKRVSRPDPQSISGPDLSELLFLPWA